MNPRGDGYSTPKIQFVTQLDPEKNDGGHDSTKTSAGMISGSRG